MGAPFDDYPDYEPHINTVLEPVTYSLAVYSAEPDEKNTVLHESRKAVVKTDMSLEGGKWNLFFKGEGLLEIYL